MVSPIRLEVQQLRDPLEPGDQWPALGPLAGFSEVLHAVFALSAASCPMEYPGGAREPAAISRTRPLKRGGLQPVAARPGQGWGPDMTSELPPRATSKEWPARIDPDVGIGSWAAPQDSERDFRAWRSALDMVTETMEASVEAGMEILVPWLAGLRGNLGDGDVWRQFVTNVCLRHPLWDILQQDPLTARSFSKPRGYAGDAVMIDYIYSNAIPRLRPSGLSQLSSRLLDVDGRYPACRAVVRRCRVLAGLIDAMASEQRGFRALSLAAGHCREVELSDAMRCGSLETLVALEQDPRSVDQMRRDYASRGVQAEIGTVRQVLSGRHPGAGRDYHLVYAAGLFDYLQQRTALHLATVLTRLVAPGGAVVIPNFARPAGVDLGYMESYMDWRLTYRSPAQMRELLDATSSAGLENGRLYSHGNGGVLYAISVRGKGGVVWSLLDGLLSRVHPGLRQA